MKNCKGIYILTNLVNGKQYVGKSVNLDHRIRQHYRCDDSCRRFHRALAARPDQFGLEIIELPSMSDEMLNALEISYIQVLGSVHPNGYNLMEGGQGGIPSLETRQKRSRTMTGKPKSDTHRRNLSKPRTNFTASESMARRGKSNRSYRPDLQAASIEICFRYQMGESCAELGRAFNAHEGTIMRLLKNIGIPVRSPGETQRIQHQRKIGGVPNA